MATEIYDNRKFTLEQIDRGIFEAIRLRLVLEGYLPDKTALSQTDYATAKKSIEDNPDNLLIEVFGVGGYQAKGQEKYNHIILDRISEGEGEINIASAFDFTAKSGNKYDKYKLPEQSDNLTYQITIITQTIKHERLLDGLIRSVIPKIGSLCGYNEDRTKTQNLFIIKRTGNVNLNNEPPNIEKVYTMIVQDVFLEEKRLMYETAEMTEFDLDIQLIKVDKSLDDNSDSTVIQYN